jgi:hypothetical protein
MPTYHLAQLNAAPLIAPMDDPLVAEFVAALDQINALAEGSPGFVWRLKDENGDNAAGIRIDDNPNMLVNVSVWENIDALYAYVYNSDHGAFFRRRREWFTKWDKPSPVMWWIPAGEHPTITDAMVRVNHMAEHGPTPYAFNFKQRFTPAEAAAFNL